MKKRDRENENPLGGKGKREIVDNCDDIEVGDDNDVVIEVGDDDEDDIEVGGGNDDDDDDDDDDGLENVSN